MVRSSDSSISVNVFYSLPHTHHHQSKQITQDRSKPIPNTQQPRQIKCESISNNIKLTLQSPTPSASLPRSFLFLPFLLHAPEKFYISINLHQTSTETERPSCPPPPIGQTAKFDIQQAPCVYSIYSAYLCYACLHKFT